jgi:hypothetical protein
MNTGEPDPEIGTQLVGPHAVAATVEPEPVSLRVSAPAEHCDCIASVASPLVASASEIPASPRIAAHVEAAPDGRQRPSLPHCQLLGHSVGDEHETAQSLNVGP